MKPNYLIILIIFPLIISGCSSFSHSKIPCPDMNKLGLIPLPDSIIISDGFFELKNTTKIVYNEKKITQDLSNYLKNKLKEYVDLELELKESSGLPRKSIVLLINFESDEPDAYQIASSSKRIMINGASESGLFYGIQTFLQLAFSSQTSTEPIYIPNIKIVDQPEFSWRGVHLDVSRHFFSVESVKKLIDQAALYKFNKFHWHLTDDQGWRIEIKSQPKLTEIGAWRNGTIIGHSKNPNATYDSIYYGGFYTQEQILEVVEYAKSRKIEIVPEIEMPGHAMAALSSYPEFSCTGGPFEVPMTWGVFEDVFCAGKDETFAFIESIITEVIDLFPGDYIHIGGDECPKIKWEKCSDCKQRIKDENLKDESELQSYFIGRIEQFVNSKGKKIIGWDEILEGGLSENATVMSWRGYEGGIEAAEKGHDVIMTPNRYCYLNFYQTQNTENEPLAIGGYLPLEKVYKYKPVPPEFTPDEAKFILGAQANIWTEYIDTQELLEYMIYPRLCAMSETLWTTQGKKDLTQFKARLSQHLTLLDKLKINYHPMQ